MYLRFFSLKSS